MKAGEVLDVLVQKRRDMKAANVDEN